MTRIVFEPFRIKVVEPITISTESQRRDWIRAAGYNTFNLRSEQVMIDLLTDSGTAAMSQDQWAAMIAADESYAGARSFFELEEVARATFGKRIVIPVHQGRAGEHLVFSTLVKPGDQIPANGHFDTTAANIEDNGGEPINLPTPEFDQLDSSYPFKGNIDLARLENLLAESADRVPFVLMTITNNTGGGQPVSVANIDAVAAICGKFNKSLFLDACRFAENAEFVKRREDGFASESASAIAKRFFRHASVITFSGKKDAIANIGGLVCLDDESLAERLKNRLIVTEGFATYGGLAGRDLAALAQGLREVVAEDYLHYRLRTIEWVVERLAAAEVPVLQPAGGHGVFLDADRFFPHIPPEQFPGIALVVELFIRGGIRGVELGNVCFGKRDESGRPVFPKYDFVRLALPRRVYTEAHIGFVVDTLIDLYRDRENVSGYEFETETPVMRHFRSTFRPVSS